MKKRISKYIKITFSVILLFYLFYYLIDFDTLVSAVKNAETNYLALSMFFMILSLLSAAYRWQYVIHMKNRSISFSASVREYFIGAFFNNFLPGSIGGDVVRIIGAAGEIDSKEIAFSSVFIERVIGLVALVAVGLIGFIFLNISSDPAFLGISLILLTTLLFGLFIIINKTANSILCELISTYLPEKISSAVLSYLKDFSGYSDSPYKLLVVFAISFGFKIFDGFFVYFVFVSLGIDLSYAHALAVFSVVNVIKMIPISFNGLGLSAVSWVLILKTFGIDENLAASVDFLTISISILVSVYGGILYFIKLNRKKKTA